MDQLAASGEDPEWLSDCIQDVRNSSEFEDISDTSERQPFPEASTEDGCGTVESEESIPVAAKKASKPHSTPLTLKWLEENYEFAEGVCIPRSTLYVHYLDYCVRNDTQPVNAASFGKFNRRQKKIRTREDVRNTTNEIPRTYADPIFPDRCPIIRQQFPQITTRRLGTRGQSKYHYYGIGVKESSSYYDIIYSAKGVQSNNGGKKDGSKQIIAYSPRSKLGTLLPEFPEIKDIKLPPNIAEDKVLTFLMMYRTHCQRILDTVIRANFDEVQSFLLHFWQGMPGHIQSILECKAIITLVGVCDSILYKAIASVLMPTVLQALPDSLTQVIRNFAKQLDEWLSVALDSLPENLQKVKFDLSRRFSQVLKRQTSLNHLCQAARTVIHSSDITSQMLEDWLNVDLNSIIKQTLYTMDNHNEAEYHSIIKLSGDFEALLEDQAPLESYIEWLDKMVDKCVVQVVSSILGEIALSGDFEALLEDKAPLESYIEWLDKMVDKCVVQPSRKHPGSLRRRARQFLLMWSCFGTRIIRDMTLHSAPSFGSFHLLHLMFDDYVLYLVESLHSQERHQEFLRAVKGEENVDILDDITLPDPSRIRESLSRLQEIAVTTESQPERGSVITNTRETLANVNSNVVGSRTINLSGHPSQLTLSPREEESAMNDDFVDQSQNASYGNVNPAYRSLASFPSFGQPLYSTQSTFRTQSSGDMGCFSYSESGPQAQTGQLPYFDNQSLDKPNSNPSGLAMYDWQQRSLPVSGINSSTGRLSDGKDYSTFTNQTRLPSVESLNYGYYESNQRDASCSIPNVLQATSQNIYGLYL